MHPIPLKLRKLLSESLSMKTCIHNNSECNGRVEWEHSWIYAGKQIQEEWSIIGCCSYHHRGKGLDKDFNRYKSLIKAMEINGSLLPIIKKYPKKNWLQEFKYLVQKYEK
jgi:hypothetical protein